MARQSFPYTSFTTPSGDPLSFGYVLIYLVDDAQSPDGLVCRGLTLRAELNTQGDIESPPQVWPTDALFPPTYYVLSGYTHNGELVLGPMKVQFMTTPPVLDGFGNAFGSSFGS